MHSFTTKLLVASIALAGPWGLGGLGSAAAKDESTVTRTSRGGVLAKTPQHQFEVFFYPGGVRVFPKNSAGQPVGILGAGGTARFYHPNSPTLWFSRPLQRTAGQSSSLDLAIGLGNAPASGVKVSFDITGLAEAGERTASFTVPLEFVKQSGPAQVTADTVARYTYGPGNAGYGYYEYSSAGPAATPASAYYRFSDPNLRYREGDSVGGNVRDWSSGRESTLAKPWLRPMD